MLLFAAQGEGGAEEDAGLAPKLLEDAVEPGRLVEPGLDATELPDLPEAGGAPGTGNTILPVLPESDAPDRDLRWPLLEDDLQLDESLSEDGGGDDASVQGQPDAFADLEGSGELGPIGLGGARIAEGFDAGILQGELLSGGFPDFLTSQGFRYGLGAQFIYDSNVYLAERDEISDLSFVLSPSIEFRSAPAGVPGLVTFGYTPFLRYYFEETDLNTVDHSANAAVSFTGTRGNFRLSTDYGRFSNTDQSFGGRRETETFSMGASAAYQLAPRTSLQGSFSRSVSTDSDLNPMSVGPLTGNEFETMQIQLVAYWQATPKTRFGPSVRFSRSLSDSIGDRDAHAFLLLANYEPRDELSFYASAGIERTSSDSAFDQDSTDFTGSFGLNYRPSERFVLGVDLSYQAIPVGSSRVSRSGGGAQSLTGGLSFTYLPNPDWSFGFDVTADAYPSVDSTNYSIGDQIFGIRATRRLVEGSLTLSGRLALSEYEAVGAVTEAREDEDRRSVSLSYQRPALGGRGQFHASVQWSENSGNRNWERFQMTSGLNIEF